MTTRAKVLRSGLKLKKASRSSKKGTPPRLPYLRRSPKELFDDAIQRALGWEAEGELRHLVHRYTGYQLTLGEADTFSQEVAALVIHALRGQL